MWPKNVVIEIFQSLYHFISSLEHTHGVIANDLKFSCDSCERKFVTRNGLLKHVCGSDIIGKGKHTCVYCHKEYGYIQSMKLHMKNAHGWSESLSKSGSFVGSPDTIITPRKKAQNIKISNNSTTNSIIMCQYCDSIHNSLDTLQAHLQEFHLEALDPQKCDICDKAFKSKKDLSSHIKRAHPDPSENEYI